MKFILPPLAFDILVLKVLGEVLACSPFGLGRQVGLRLGGPCRIRLFRLLFHLTRSFMLWLGVTACILVIRDQKLVLGQTDNSLSCPGPSLSYSRVLVRREPELLRITRTHSHVAYGL